MLAYAGGLTGTNLELLPGRKVAAAILTGTEYQKELLNSFDEVQKRSDYLIQKARNSHYEDTRVAMLEILSREDRLLAGQVEIARNSAEMKNCLYGLMQVYVRDRELDRQQHREELRRRDEMQKQQDAMHRRDHQGNVQSTITNRQFRAR